MSVNQASQKPVLYERVDERGKRFVVHGDKQKVLENLRSLIGVPKDDDEHGLDHLGGNNRWGNAEQYTEANRQKEEQQLQQLINQIEEGQMESWFDMIPKKKDGTFAKRRVTTIWRGYSYEWYWEDSYGYNGPELVLRTLDDMTAVLQVEDRIRQI